MRGFEVLFMAALAWLILLPLLKVKWRSVAMDGVFGVAVLALVGHLWFEGWRWQMVPLYGLLLGVGWLSLKYASLPQQTGLKARPASVVIRFPLLLLWAGLVLPPVLVPVPDLPQPSGPFAIGTRTLYLVDENRAEIYGPTPGEPRELMVQVWYPAQPPTRPNRVETAPYMQPLNVIGPALGREFGLPPVMFSHLNLAYGHAMPNAPGNRFGGPYPVVVMSHGWSGLRTQSTYLVEALASHGYVVIAIDHSYGATVTVFPDGRAAFIDNNALPAGVSAAEYAEAADTLGSWWAADIRFVLDQLPGWQAVGGQFEGLINRERVALMGHSTGGGAAVEACWRDTRCKAVVGLDVWMPPVAQGAVDAGLAMPALYLYSEIWPNDQPSRIARLDRLIANSSGAHWWIEVEGAHHYNFTDFPQLTPLLGPAGLSVGPIEHRQMVAIVTGYTLDFLDVHLKTREASLLNTWPSPYPEASLR